MTRILQSGFELGDTLQIGADTTTQTNATAAVSIVSATPTARSGTYCLKCSLSSVAFNGSGTAYKSIAHASLTEVWYAFGFQVQSNNTTVGGAYLQFFRNYDTAGNVNLILAMDSGTIRAYYANAGGAAPTTSQVTLIGSGSTSVSTGAWHLLEIRYIPSTTTGGTLEIYLNGSQILNATATRTAQSNANTASFALGAFIPTSGGSGTVTGVFAYDDVRVNSTAGSVNNGRPNDESVVLLVPNAAGDSTQFSRGGTDSGSNYGQVDEIPPNGTTDYVYDSVVGHLDLYNLPTLSISSISAIQVIMQAFDPDGGGGSLYMVTKSPAGQSDGTAQAVTTTPTYYSRLLETDPADSAAWTQTKLTALQIGVKIAS
jgi:hypothetical protein